MKTEKIINLILYISKNMESSEEYGSTVLNKVLYYIDRKIFIDKGDSLTGFSYIKQKNGPTPLPEQFLSIRSKMIANKQLELQNVKYYGRDQKKPVALKDADLKVFKSTELSVINKVIKDFYSENATSSSNTSHKEIAYDFAELTEKLPNYTFLLSKEKPNKNDISWAESAYRRKSLLSNN